MAEVSDVAPTCGVWLLTPSEVLVASELLLVLSLLNCLPNSALTTRSTSAFDGTGSMMAVLSESGIDFSAHTISPMTRANTTICVAMKGHVRAVGL
jgi:hypothetical protein